MKKNLFTLGGFVDSQNQVLARVTKPLVKDHWNNLRFHIDDTSSKINIQELSTLVETAQKNKDTKIAASVKLKEILLDWEGYKYYPDLENIEIRFIYAPLVRYPALYVELYDRIYINSEKLYKEYEKQRTTPDVGIYSKTSNTTGASGARNKVSFGSPRINLWQYTGSLLFHELQHAIQHRERINMPPTTDEYILERSQLKYQKGNLSPEQFKKWLCEKHNTTSLREAIDVEYRDLPTEKECIAVEQEILRHYEERGFMKDGGVISSLNTKYSFKDLFKNKKA